MKKWKKQIAIVSVAAMTNIMVPQEFYNQNPTVVYAATAADKTTNLADYEAYYTFDETLSGARAISRGSGYHVGEYVEKEFSYTTGMNGQALVINDTDDNVGVDTNIIINNTYSFTVSFWAKAYNAPFACPLIWIGDADQISYANESWIGFWAGFNNGTWSTACGIGSNDADGNRVGCTYGLSETGQFEYTYITFSVDASTHKGILYYDGVKVAETTEELPVLRDGSRVYVGANAWDYPPHFEIDDLAIYKRVLSGEEITALYQQNGLPTAKEITEEQLVWEAEPQYAYEDVVAVKDIFPQGITDASIENNGNYQGRVFYYENGQAGMADYAGNSIMDSSYGLYLDCRQGITALKDYSRYNANGYKYGSGGGGGGFQFYWNELTQKVLDSEIEITERDTWSHSYMTVMKSVNFDSDYAGVYPIPEGALVFNNTYRLVGKDGQLVSEEQFEDIKCDSSLCKNIVGEYAIVKLNGKWGYIKSDGTWLTQCIYEDAYPFRDGIAAVKKDGKAGFIRVNGSEVFEFLFEETRSMHDGKAWVKMDGKWGVLNVAKTVGWSVADYNTKEQMQAAAVELLSGDNMISDYGSMIMFFDYDMDGKLELYHCYEARGDGAIYGYIYSYESGSYWLLDTFDLTKSDKFYTVYRNSDGGYMFIEKETYTQSGYEEIFYKYDVATKIRTKIAYYMEAYDSTTGKDTITYYSADGSIVTQADYNRLLEAVVVRHKNLNVTYDLVSVYPGYDLEEKVAEAWDGYTIEDTNRQELAITGWADASVVTKGMQVTITGQASGGDKGYTYSYLIYNVDTNTWARLTPAFVEDSTYTWTAGNVGKRRFYVEVKDCSGTVVRSEAIAVTVMNPGLGIIGNASSAKIEKGEKVKITGIAAGGSGGYTYSYLVYNRTTGTWARLTSSFVASNTFTWTAGSAGIRDFYVEVKDSSGKVVRSSAITVETTNPELSISGTVSATEVVKGEKITITGTATGGAGNYTYSYLVYNRDTKVWARLTPAFTANNTFTWTAGSVGTRDFYVEVKDGTGKVVRSKAMTVITENSELSITGKASISTVTIGGKVTISGIASGGQGGYTYSYLVYNRTTGQWARLTPAFVSGNCFNWTAGSAGTRDFYVEVKDAAGKIVRSKAVTVVTIDTELKITGSSSTEIVMTGNKVTITGNAGGGAGSYTYSYLMYNVSSNTWSRLTPSFITDNTYTWTAGNIGNCKFYVEVKDSTGKVVRSNPVTVKTESVADARARVVGRWNLVTVFDANGKQYSARSFYGSMIYTDGGYHAYIEFNKDGTFKSYIIDYENNYGTYTVDGDKIHLTFTSTDSYFTCGSEMWIDETGRLCGMKYSDSSISGYSEMRNYYDKVEE